MSLQQLFLQWYSWLSAPTSALALPIQDLSDQLNMPLLSAFLFGLLGTTAPCQLTTNVGALAFLSRQPGDRSATVRATLAYMAAKMAVYTILGLVVLTLGQQLSTALIPYIEVARKILGPGMILLGLAVLGVIRVRWQIGQGLGRRLEQKAAAELGTGGRAPLSWRLAPRAQMALVTAGAAAEPGRSDRPPASVTTANNPAPGVRAGFLLGLAFSCTFCPTLFLLFFGVTMTLAARSAGGMAFPAVFALGTTLPLAVFVGLVLTSTSAAERFLRGMRRANRPLRWVGGVLLVLLGLHDTVVYWFL